VLVHFDELKDFEKYVFEDSRYLDDNRAHSRKACK
jgi:hypothetical protein